MGENLLMKKIFRLLLAVWFLCFCVITLKKETIFTSFFHNVKDIFTGQLLQEEKEVVVYDDLYHLYYALLDEKEKRIYAKIIDCTNALETTLKPYDADITEKNIANAYQAVMFDCPELFWLEQGYSYEVLENMGVVSVTLSFHETAEDLAEHQQLFQKASEEIVQNALVYPSDEERERYVHDALCERITYDLEATMNQSAYSALVNHQTVCAGYAKAFQYILKQLSIPCAYVTGSAEGEDHAWNIVFLDGSWWNVDVTWDDDLEDPYMFFNLKDDVFDETHARSEMSAFLPACE